MAEVKMTVQEALTKKKILKKEFQKLVQDAQGMDFVAFATDVDDTINGLPIEDAINKMKSNYNKVRAVVSNLAAITAAINRSNAETEITVGDVKYTIADAISIQNSLETEKAVFDIIASSYNDALKYIQRVNDRNLNPDAISDHISKILGSMNSGSESGSSKKNSDLIKSLEEQYRTNTTLKLVDPVGYEKVLEKWNNDIVTFETNIHNALITSNVSTIITVNFVD